MKLLVNTPSGMQELIQIGEGGGYFDQARVLWDERADGLLPEITLGGMVRVGDGLTFDQARMDGSIAAWAPTVTQYTAAIQAMLDTKAQERHYDGILSACTYATSSVPSFAAEGQACVDWRDAVWSESYALMAQVEGGTLAQPTIAGLLAMLPAMTWPA
jgi:hypothetical protein